MYEFVSSNSLPRFSYCCYPRNNGINSEYFFPPLAQVNLPGGISVPSADEVYDDAFDLVWPELLTYFSALTGIVCIVLFIRSISGE